MHRLHHVREQHRYLLALPLERGALRADPLSEVSGPILAQVERRRGATLQVVVHDVGPNQVIGSQPCEDACERLSIDIAPARGFRHCRRRDLATDERGRSASAANVEHADEQGEGGNLADQLLSGGQVRERDRGHYASGTGRQHPDAFRATDRRSGVTCLERRFESLRPFGMSGAAVMVPAGRIPRDGDGH